MFVAVYDTDAPNAIGYTFSTDGIYWSAGQHLVVQKDAGLWATEGARRLGSWKKAPIPSRSFTPQTKKLRERHRQERYCVDPGSMGMVEVQLKRGVATAAADIDELGPFLWEAMETN